jgi:hypothetical protein
VSERAGRAVALVLIVALAAIAPANVAMAQVSEGQPTASIKKATWNVGDTLFVEGNHWPRGNVAVQVCGNNAVNGTPDCELMGARNFGVSLGDGAFRGNLVVALPPVPCPCVVVVRSSSSSAQFSIPITINGAEVQAGPPPVRHDPAQTTISVESKIDRGPLWRDALAIQPSRSMTITITNTGPIATGPGSVDVTYGKGKVPTGFGETVGFTSIDPGANTVLHVDFPLEPISFGDYNLRVRVDSSYAHDEKLHKVSVHPWGLGVVLIGLIAIVDLLIVRRVWASRRKRAEAAELAEVTEQAEAEDDTLVLTEVPVVAAVEAPVLALVGAPGGAAPGVTSWTPPSLESLLAPTRTNGHVVFPLVARETCTHTFVLRGFDDARTVAVCGSFNGWDGAASPMLHLRGRWTATIELEPGQVHRYRFLVDGEHWEDDPLATERAWNDYGSEDCIIRT